MSSKAWHLRPGAHACRYHTLLLVVSVRPSAVGGCEQKQRSDCSMGFPVAPHLDERGLCFVGFRSFEARGHSRVSVGFHGTSMDSSG